jgi:site-specific DNA-cytosine methylase
MLEDIVLPDAEPEVLHNLYGGFKEESVRVSVGKSPTIRTAGGGGHIPSVVKKDLLHSEKAIEYMNSRLKDGRDHWDFGHHSDIRKGKSSVVVSNFFKGVPYNVFKDWNCIRKFHPIECERLQTLPDNYTEGVSNTQRYKAIGNGWTVDVIAHIFKFLKE